MPPTYTIHQVDPRVQRCVMCEHPLQECRGDCHSARRDPVERYARRPGQTTSIGPQAAADVERYRRATALVSKANAAASDLHRCGFPEQAKELYKRARRVEIEAGNLAQPLFEHAKQLALKERLSWNDACARIGLPTGA